MFDISPTTILQVVIGLGLLNVWFLRSRIATSFRGGEAQSLKDEFAVYGLPSWFFYVIGTLKVSAAVVLIAGLWMPSVVLAAAGVVSILMLGAITMHIRVGDPASKSVPAMAMFTMSAALCLLMIPV